MYTVAKLGSHTHLRTLCRQGYIGSIILCMYHLEGKTLVILLQSLGVAHKCYLNIIEYERFSSFDSFRVQIYGYLDFLVWKWRVSPCSQRGDYGGSGQDSGVAETKSDSECASFPSTPPQTHLLRLI